MIIIKSQDGMRLIKCASVRFGRYDDVFEFSVSRHNENKAFFIATYRTQKRAGEVMAEVEQRIKDLYTSDIIKHTANCDLAMEDSEKFLKIFHEEHEKLAIYTMPQE